jgi:hypothetical protein
MLILLRGIFLLSDLLDQNETFIPTFIEVVESPFYCESHPTMLGKVVGTSTLPLPALQEFLNI